MYYYLAHTYRKFGAVRKIRVYLGRDLGEADLARKRIEAEVVLQQKLSRAKGIRDPYKFVLSRSEISELKKMLPSGRIKLAHFSEDNWLSFTEAFTYDTNAIEGSTVNQKEVVNILEDIQLPAKPREEISETLGVAEAVKLIRGTKEHISLELILDLHRTVFKNSKSFAGHFRNPGEEVAVVDEDHNVIHRGAPSRDVERLLKELIAWYHVNESVYPPLVLAVVVHNQFENIHPFADGNGRVGRLLLNNILLKHEMPPVNIELVHRMEYYQALRSYEHDDDIRPSIDLLLKEYRKHAKTK